MGMHRFQQRRCALAVLRHFLVCCIVLKQGNGIRLHTRLTRDGKAADKVVRQSSKAVNFEGVYRIRHKETARYLDAYMRRIFQNRPGYEAITRFRQHLNTDDGEDRTQHWTISSEGHGIYSIMQFTSGRFLQASTSTGDGTWHSSFVCSTKIAEFKAEDALDSNWFIGKLGSATSELEVRIAQASTQRYLDAYSSGMQDYQVMTTPNKSDSNIWVLERVYDRPLPLFDGLYTIQQKSTGRQLDAEGDVGMAGVVTRISRYSASQHFIIRSVRGEVYTVAQQSSARTLGKCVGAHEFAVSVCSGQSDAGSQEWLLVRHTYDEFSLQHVETGRLLDAEPDANDGRAFRAFTSAPTLPGVDGNVSSQVWIFKKLRALPKFSGYHRLELGGTGRCMGHDGNGSIRLEPSGSDACIWEFERLRGDSYRILTNDSRALAQQGPGLPPVLVPVQKHEQTMKILGGEASKNFQTTENTTQKKDMKVQDATEQQNMKTQDAAKTNNQRAQARTQAGDETAKGAGSAAQHAESAKDKKQSRNKATGQDTTRANQQTGDVKQNQNMKAQNAGAANNQKAVARAQGGDETAKDAESAKDMKQSRNEVTGRDATRANQKMADDQQKNSIKSKDAVTADNQQAKAGTKAGDATAKDAVSIKDETHSRNKAAEHDATRTNQKTEDVQQTNNMEAQDATAEDSASAKAVKQSRNNVTGQDATETKKVKSQDVATADNQKAEAGARAGDEAAKDGVSAKNAKQSSNNVTGQDAAETKKMQSQDAATADNQKVAGARAGDEAAKDGVSAKDVQQSSKEVRGQDAMKQNKMKSQDVATADTQKAQAGAQAGDETGAKDVKQSKNEVTGQDATSQKARKSQDVATADTQKAQARAQAGDETGAKDVKQSKNEVMGQDATNQKARKSSDVATADTQKAQAAAQAGDETAKDIVSVKDSKQTTKQVTGQDATKQKKMKSQDVATVDNQKAQAGEQAGDETAKDRVSVKDLKQSESGTATGNQSTKKVMQTSEVTGQDATRVDQNIADAAQAKNGRVQDAADVNSQEMSANKQIKNDITGQDADGTAAADKSPKNITVKKDMTVQEEKQQLWDVLFTGTVQFRIKHDSSGMVIAVQKDEKKGFQLVTEEAKDSDPQTWLSEKVADSNQSCAARLASCPSVHECGFVDDLCGGTLACGSMGDGSCWQRNMVTWQPYMCTAEHTCKCQRRVACMSETSCGHEPDGCGSVVTCGRYGLCRQKNLVTGEHYECSVNKTVVQTLNVALANGSAVTGLAARSGDCDCLPMPCNRSFGAACGILEDGCGGKVNCLCELRETTTSTTTTVTTTSTISQATTTTTCKPRDKCDEGMHCGFQSDGCGGKLACGSSAGSCLNGRNLTCTTDHRCVCTPLTCEGRCGIVDDGCGEEIACKCSMSNEMCDRELQICIAVPQPPSQGLGSLANLTWNNSNSTFDNASFPYADAIAGNGSALPGFEKDGKPVLDPVSNKRILTPELFKLYTFYYYFYYYYHLLELKAAHVSAEDAAKEAAVLAKPSAAEQLRITFFNETESSQEEKVITGHLDDPIVVKFLAASLRMHDARNSRSNPVDKQAASQAAALARRAVSNPSLRR